MTCNDDFLPENLADQVIKPTRERLRRLRESRERNDEDERLDSNQHGQAKEINCMNRMRRTYE